MKYRIEKDTIGTVKIEVKNLWGIQTQRSLDNFKIGYDKMPLGIIHAIAVLKSSAASANAKLGLLDKSIACEISIACNEILENKHLEQFPLVVWQTGSGTQTNMNVNEVVARIVNKRNKVRKIHSNDDVNKCQSSNDVFPSAMHIASVFVLNNFLLPSLCSLYLTLNKLSKKYMNIIKIGRTHLQDATPITLGQEISGWSKMIEVSIRMIKESGKYLNELAIGGTAVGTGLNANKNFAKEVVINVNKLTGFKFTSSKNKFHSLTSKDAIVNSHGSLKALAANLMKIANDVRLLSSGPRCGIGEITIPQNEAGSSIMPGKVNPTQCEALTMVVCQVMGNDTTIGFAASQGHLELNTYMPVIIKNYLDSVILLSDAINSFNNNCVVGIKPNIAVIKKNLDHSLMLVTALNPSIGYDKAAMISKNAYLKNISLKQSATELKIISKKEFDKLVDPKKMV